MTTATASTTWPITFEDVERARERVAPHLTATPRSEEHTSELQSPYDLVCRLLLEKKKNNNITYITIHSNSSSTYMLSPRRFHLLRATLWILIPSPHPASSRLYLPRASIHLHLIVP